MKRTKKTSSLLTTAAAVAGVAMGASIAMAAHPTIPLYTYEEVGTQYGMPQGVGMRVMVQAGSKQGMPYSPKMTCSGGGVSSGKCHADNTNDVKTGTTNKLKGYTALADHAFHGALGYNEWMDNAPSGLFIANATDATSGISGLTHEGTQTGLVANKPWVQSHGHNGKW